MGGSHSQRQRSQSHLVEVVNLRVAGATKFDARLRGDRGEVYTTAGKIV